MVMAMVAATSIGQTLLTSGHSPKTFIFNNLFRREIKVPRFSRAHMLVEDTIIHSLVEQRFVEHLLCAGMGGYS